ncbi:MAG: NUDIX hydrolase [Oscillospiraceae bacterium]|nr:NUDIX hydrolase [Oscillospiraceae bacterium]
MKLTEKTLIHQVVFEGKIINMRQDTVLLENEKTATRDVVEHPGGVCVLPLTDAGEIIMVKQFRYPYKEVLLEIPAGKLDKGNEDPLDCGKRELEEETGMTAEEYLSLGKMYPSPGYCDEIIHMYLAKGLHPSKQHLDEDEFLEVYKIPFETVLSEILSGQLTDAKTQIAVLKAARILGL